MDMSMASRVPDWLTPLAWVWIAASLASAVVLAARVRAGRRSGSPVADAVWVSTALYLGPLALLLHHRHTGHARTGGEPSGVVAGLPGGAASALAHLVGVPLVVASGLTIAGLDLWPMILVIGAVAVALLVVHERARAAERGQSVGLARAVLVAVVTVLAFDVGMGGWMLLLHYSSFMPPPSTGSFWFLMQLGIVLGLVTAFPVVRRLADSRVAPAPA